MRVAVIFAAILALGALALVEPAAALQPKYRVADAASDSCRAQCSSKIEACKRVCPSTFSTPCLNSCDNQAMACRQSCDRAR